MRFFAAVFYFCLKLLVFLSTRIFYSKFTVINKEALRFKKPTIVVSNHPSTLLDPLNVGVEIPKQIYFLANAGLFKNPIMGAILNQYCIPIERPKDVGGRRIQNDENFARADDHLTKGRCLYVAAEGTSVVERRIRKIKTGTARIALSAENKNDFKLGVTIIPVGLNYTSPLEFQSEVVVNVGQPIAVNDYRTVYNENPFHAAKQLTADLQGKIEALVFHTDAANDEQDQLLSHIEAVFQSEEPLSAEAGFFRTQKILGQLNALDEKELADFKISGNQYFDLLAKTDLNDAAISKSLKKRSVIADVFKLIFGLPLFLYGWINNFLGFFIPGFLSRTLKIYHGYKPAVMVMSGLIFIPLFYYLQVKFISHYINLPYSGWIYLLTLLPMGWIAWRYLTFVKKYTEENKARKLKAKNAVIFKDLISKRNNFWSKIKVLK